MQKDEKQYEYIRINMRTEVPDSCQAATYIALKECEPAHPPCDAWYDLRRLNTSSEKFPVAQAWNLSRMNLREFTPYPSDFKFLSLFCISVWRNFRAHEAFFLKQASAAVLGRSHLKCLRYVIKSDYPMTPHLHVKLLCVNHPPAPEGWRLFACR